MPYVGKEREAELISNSRIANKSGDYNALYTMAYLKEFLASPCYGTIHQIRKASINPTVIRDVEDVELTLMGLGVSSLDLTVARELAFEEFYFRIGAPYENLARNKNGDLQLYKDAQEKLYEIARELALKQSALGGKK